MRLYVEVVRRGFRRYASYRAATLAGIFTNTVFAFIQAFVMLALYESRAEIGGFDAVEALTYVFVAQGLVAPMDVFTGGVGGDR